MPWGDERPQTRGDCIGRPRPCPWVGCRFNLMLEVGKGSLKPMSGAQRGGSGYRGRPLTVERRDQAVRLVVQKDNGRYYPTMSTERMERVTDELADRLVEWFTTHDQPSCALDVADQAQGLTLEETAQAFGITRERVRQIEVVALRRVRANARAFRLKREDWTG